MSPEDVFTLTQLINHGLVIGAAIFAGQLVMIMLAAVTLVRGSG